MSRVASNPVGIPAGVEVKINDNDVAVKGGNGALNLSVHHSVTVKHEDNVITFAPKHGDKASDAMAGPCERWSTIW